MSVKAVVAASIIAAFVTPAIAANSFYVVQDVKTKKCTITEFEADNVRDHRRERRYGLQDPVGGRIRHENHQSLHVQLTLLITAFGVAMPPP